MGGRGSWSRTAGAAVVKTQKGHDEGPQVGGHAKADSAAEIAGHLGMADEALAFSYYKAVAEYSGSDYSAIRRAARTGGPDDRWKRCEEYIARAPQWEGGTTYRGIVLDPGKLSAIKVGDRIDANGGGPASWSTSISTSESFAKNSGGRSVVFIATSQRDATSIKGISRHPSENEVLVSKSTMYRVTGVSQGAGARNYRTYIEVEVV